MNDTNDTIITHTVDHLCLSMDNFISYIISHDYNENMFNKDGTLNMNYIKMKLTNIDQMPIKKFLKLLIAIIKT